MTQFSALTAANVSRSYDGAQIVSGVDLTLAPGTITALLGKSGAGKSTLLRLLAGLEPVDSGEIKIGETVLSSPRKTTPPETRKIGLIFQDFALFPHLNAAQNIMFGLAHLPPTERKARASEWLSRLDLSTRAKAYPHELSGGEQQRIAIARALAPSPAAILMDEPFSGLDPSLRATVRNTALDTIREAGVPALLVTHDADEALSGADNIAIMDGGKILQQGPAQDVYLHPVSAKATSALSPIICLPVANLPADLLNGISGVGDNLILRPEGITPTPNAPTYATITAVHFHGPHKRIMLDLNGTQLVCLSDHTTDTVIGSQIGIALNPRAAFIFGSDGI